MPTGRRGCRAGRLFHAFRLNRLRELLTAAAPGWSGTSAPVSWATWFAAYVHAQCKSEGRLCYLWTLWTEGLRTSETHERRPRGGAGQVGQVMVVPYDRVETLLLRG